LKILRANIITPVKKIEKKITMVFNF
jgi:hypothetical protein